MNALTVTATSGCSDCTAVVVGHCAAKLPRLVETVAAKLAKGDLTGAQRMGHGRRPVDDDVGCA